MLTDEQYGHQLGAQLRCEIEDVHAAAGLAGKVRRQHARRAWTIRTAFATPVVAAAAVAAIMAATAGQSVPGANGSPVQMENVAYVQTRTIKALSQAEQYVIYAKTTWEGGHDDKWIDKATQRYRMDSYNRSYPSFAVTRDAQGNVVVQASPPPDELTLGPIHLTGSLSVSGPEGNQNMVNVDHDRRTWWTDHLTDTRPPSVPPDITDADSIRKAMTDGKLELLGEEKVDGIDTLHLRLYGPNRSYRIDMWVDSTSYLPVQDTAAKSSGNTGPEEFPASLTFTTKYSWLPRIEENLARLVLTPPPGFQRLK